MVWGLLVWQNLYEILRFIQQDPGSGLCEGPILPVWGSHSAQYTFTSSDTLSLSPIIMCFYTGGSRLHALRRSDLTSMRLSLGLHFHFLPYDCVFIQVDPSSRLCESPILPVCLIGGERGERSMTKLKLSFENSFTSSPKYLEIKIPDEKQGFVRVRSYPYGALTLCLIGRERAKRGAWSITAVQINQHEDEAHFV